MATKDPYRYFRVEARELVEALSGLALELERSGGGAEPVAQILRNAHTLKGAARVVKHAVIAELAHAAESVLEPYRTGGTVERTRIDELLAIMDKMSAALARIQETSAAAPTTAPTKAIEPMLESLRVDVDEVDGLLDSVVEVQVQMTSLRRMTIEAEEARVMARGLVEQLAVTGRFEASPRARAAAEALRTHLARHERELGQTLSQMGPALAQVREQAGRLRLVPVSSIVTALERAVRDAANAMGKQVRLIFTGGQMRLDAHVLTGVRDALLHVVRNAVTHGIEAPLVRAGAGKPNGGIIAVEAVRHGRWVVFRCRDDGAGLDVAAITRQAIARGRLNAQANLDEASAAELLLSGGVSTARVVDELAGRGVGLDAVRAIATGLKGEVLLTSQRGAGVTVELRVPMTLASIRALNVRVADTEVAVPLDAVRATLRVNDNELTHAAERRALVYEGAAIPFSSLAKVLGHAESTRETWTTLVVQAGDSLAALAVDRLSGTSEVLLRPPPRLAGADDIIAGAALDDEGNPKLVLDAVGIIAAARRQRDGLRKQATTRAPLLVVDDSLTTRMLEQAILESAGYEVDLAASGEEGLVKAAAKRYGVILCDVEMPGMDGFEFVTRTKADATLREVPTILVTSRDTDADRARGFEVGAADYVVKGEFDQGRLLETIDRLLIRQ